jgi:hypothetical protein
MTSLPAASARGLSPAPLVRVVFYTVFVVGLIAIPFLYWLSTKETGPDPGQKRNEQEKSKRETRPQ